MHPTDTNSIMPNGSSPYLPHNESYKSLTKNNYISILKHKQERKKLKVQIINDNTSESNDSEKDEDLGKINQLFEFYKSKSKLSKRSEIGAQKNKLQGKGKTEEEKINDANHRVCSRQTKQRVNKYETQKVIDTEVQAFFDKVKLYPKTN